MLDDRVLTNHLYKHIVISIPGLIEDTVDVVLSGLQDKNAYVRKASVMAAYKLHVTSPSAAICMQ